MDKGAKPDIHAFLRAVASGDKEAFGSLLQAYFLPDGRPGPEIETFAGDWDGAPLKLEFVTSVGCCLGKVSTTKFCSRQEDDCKIVAHRAKVDVDTGWYVCPRAETHFLHPFFAAAAHGGVIDDAVAAGVKEFELPLGVWSFLATLANAGGYVATTGGNDPAGRGQAAAPITSASSVGGGGTSRTASRLASLLVSPRKVVKGALSAARGAAVAGSTPDLVALQEENAALADLIDTHQAEAEARYAKLEARAIESEAFHVQFLDIIDELKARLDAADRPATNVAARGVASDLGIRLALLEDKAVLKTEQDARRDQQLDSLNSRVGNKGGLVFHGVSYARPQSLVFKTWTPYYAVDALVALHSLVRSVHNNSDMLSNLVAQTKAGLFSDLEIAGRTSFVATFPSAMVNFSKTYDQSKGLRGAIKSFDDWYLPSEACVTTYIGTHLDTFFPALEAQLELADLSSDFRTLCTHTILDTKDFLRDFFSFTRVFYAELTRQGAFSAERAWQTLAEIIDVIFLELRKVREPLKGFKNPEHYVWAILRTHEVMQEFRTARFRSDPRIVAVLVKHALVRGAESESQRRLDQTCRQLDQTSKSVAELKRQFEGLSKTVKTLKTSVDSA